MTSYNIIIGCCPPKLWECDTVPGREQKLDASLQNILLAKKLHLLGFIFQSKYKENGQIIKKLLKKQMNNQKN
jgi:hypothetical protein